MRDTRDRSADGQAPVGRLLVVGIAALALLFTGAGGPGNAAARPAQHDAARASGAHQAESPNLATPAPYSPLSTCLLGSWLHAWEEDTAQTIVYRSADYPFGPSRGRDGYEFQPNGVLVYHGFGPADGPLTSPGLWAGTGPEQIHVTVNDPAGAYIDETLRIVSCDAEALQVERVVQPATWRRAHVS